MIKSIVEETGAKIDVSDDGTVSIAAVDGEGGKAALARIQAITASPEVGKTYLGKVTRIVDFGAFVEIFAGTEGLLHISEISEQRIREVGDELKLGDQILVKCLALEGNKIKLSRRAVLAEQRDKRPDDGSSAPRDRPSGDRDRPSGDRDRPSGDRDRPSGDRDRPSGDRDRPRGDRDRPSGDRSRRRGSRPRGDREGRDAPKPESSEDSRDQPKDEPRED